MNKLNTIKAYKTDLRTYSFINIFIVLLTMLLVSGLTGCATMHRSESTVTVEGTGTVKAVPDTVSLSVSVNETAGTTREAQTMVNTKVRRVLDIIGAAGVEERNIRTASISFSPEYSWKEGIQTLLGQNANQTIVFRLEDIGGNPKQLSSLLDNLTSVDGIRMQQMYFDIEDKTPLYSDSRELAYRKALAKAVEYAAFSGLTVGRVLSISETGPSSFPGPMTNRMLMESTAPEGAGGTALPTGEIEITTRITAVFQLK